MKKTFSLKVDNKTPERQADSIKHEVKKYMTREKKKEKPKNADFWDFACKIGDSEANAKKIHEGEINKSISKFVEAEADTFYLEVMAIAGYKPAKK